MRLVPSGRGVVTWTKEDFSDAVYLSHPTVAILGYLRPFALSLRGTGCAEEVFFYG